VYQPLQQAGIPLLVTAGNHDGSGFPAFELERERFVVQWQPRKPELVFLPGSEWPRRYAAMLEDVLLVTFDGTVPGKLRPSELRFIDRMLAAHSGRARATVVFSHLPFWPFTQGREDDILEDSNLLSLLHRAGVDVFVSGHHHAFYAGTDIAGMVHVSVGALGGNVRPLVGTRKRQQHSYVILRIAGDRLEVGSRVADEFIEPVPYRSLPERLGGPLGSLKRLGGPVPLRSVSPTNHEN
jgi:3',5'-cyclic AMP phosphodiesterase CpdA